MTAWPLECVQVDYDSNLDRTDSDFTVVQYGAIDRSKSVSWLREALSSADDASAIASWLPKGKFVSGVYQAGEEAIEWPDGGDVASTTCPDRVFPVCLGVMIQGSCLCQKGQSKGSPWLEPCQPCASGTFNDEEGSECRPCPAGTFSLASPGEVG